MKIVMFGHKCVPSRAGGVEVVVEQLSTRMAALGHNVTCCNRGGAKAAALQGVRLKRVPTLQWRGLAAVTASFFAALYAALGDADVCHIHGEGPAAMCFLPKLFGKRVVVTVHGLDWRREKWRGGVGAAYIRMGERIAVKQAHEIIVLSRSMQDYFLQTYGRKTRLIPNGVPEVKPLPPREIFDRYGLEKDGYILFLGRLVPEKGVHELIEAFRAVKTEKRLIIAGVASDTEAYVRQLQKLAAADSRICFTGFVEGDILTELYSNAYLYVLPSHLEGMPLSLLEAMSCSNCCVVSDISECTEVMQNHAVVFPAGNVQALRSAMQRLCDDPQQVERYRKAVREYVRGKCGWETVTKKTLEIYRENSAGS